MTPAYYNEIDPYAAQWLRNLIKAGHIPAGEVDERSIKEVRPSDLLGYKQCHFFAGIGGWAYAARLVGWPDDRPMWTGSCPCQPFSVAGQRKGDADDRHLWPEFARLIGQCKPSIIFGEQVASSDGRKWLNGVRLDLEALGYGVGAADLRAASAGEKKWVEIVDELTGAIVWEGELLISAPHIRQRLFWVGMADAGRTRLEERQKQLTREELAPAERSGDARRLVDTERDADSERMEHATGDRRQQRRAESIGRGVIGGCGWSNFDVVHCADGKARRIESGSFPLAHGVPNRVGKLRAYGNAIVGQLAAKFIGVMMP